MLPATQDHRGTPRHIEKRTSRIGRPILCSHRAGWRALAQEQWRTGDARARPSCRVTCGEALAGDLPPSCRCSQPWQSEREWIEGCAWVCVREGNEQTTERHHVVLVRVCVRLCVLDNERARIVLYPAAAPAAD